MKKLSEKDLKKIAIPLVSVVALGAGAVVGMNQVETDSLTSGLTLLVGAICTVLGAFGIFNNNDKK